MSLNVCFLLILTENSNLRSIELKADWCVISLHYHTMMPLRSYQVEGIDHCICQPVIPGFNLRRSLFLYRDYGLHIRVIYLPTP